MSLICIPIRARTMPELGRLVRRAEKKADVIEIWLDALDGRIPPEKIIGISSKPLLIVNKGAAEKGGFSGPQAERIGILAGYALVGADFIDVPLAAAEMFMRMIGRRKRKSKIIVSYHDFKATPSFKRLRQIRDRGFAAGADIVKIATFAKVMGDNLKILSLLSETPRAKKLIAFCMGGKGIPSRVFASRCGSYMIYLALDPRHATAPGQLTVEKYEKITSLLLT